jgi:hypothetical protein
MRAALPGGGRVLSSREVAAGCGAIGARMVQLALLREGEAPA